MIMNNQDNVKLVDVNDAQLKWANDNAKSFDSEDAEWYLALAQTQEGQEATNSILTSIAVSLLELRDDALERRCVRNAK